MINWDNKKVEREKKKRTLGTHADCLTLQENYILTSTIRNKQKFYAGEWITIFRKINPQVCLKKLEIPFYK